LPLYAVLRSVSGKLSGIALVLVLILALVLLPFYLRNTLIRSAFFKPFFALNFWFFIFVCLILGMLGGLPVIQPYTTFGIHFIFYYFISLFVIFPSLNFLDKFLYDVYVYAGLENTFVFEFNFELTNPLNTYLSP
jgi:quinol-cytochrome oxidoreductase complex cytochrome b subunit